MRDQALIEALGNFAARTIAGKYPTITVKFFVNTGQDDIRIYIVAKSDTSEKTGRLYDLGPLPETPLAGDLSRLLERRIEERVRSFLNLD